MIIILMNIYTYTFEIVITAVGHYCLYRITIANMLHTSRDRIYYLIHNLPVNLLNSK